MKKWWCRRVLKDIREFRPEISVARPTVALANKCGYLRFISSSRSQVNSGPHREFQQTFTIGIHLRLSFLTPRSKISIVQPRSEERPGEAFSGLIKTYYHFGAATGEAAVVSPTEGYEDALVIPAITAENFELKHGLLTLVHNNQFFGHDKEDPHAHVRYFNKITSTLKFPDVPNTSIKLMLFPFSLKGAAQISLEKEPPRSIFTWDDLVSKFINQFFPPSKTTNLRNEITNFQQRFDESFSEAWDRFKDLLRACTFLDRMPRECLGVIENKSKVRYSCNKPIVAKVSTTASTSGVSPDVAELKDMVRALLLDKKVNLLLP
nr:reverse transcriptase domain-containing protein [Tanacetum cinerariifolium]